MKHIGIYIVLILSASILLPGLDYASANIATTHYNFLALNLSESCVKMNKYLKNNPCPKIKDLVSFDTSNQYISGKFLKQNGEVVRTQPQVTNHYMFYESRTKPVICLDCVYPGGLPDIIQTITIDPSNFTWANTLETTDRSKLVSHKNFFVTEDCKNGNLVYTNKTLTLLIDYMQNGCKDKSFNNNGTIPLGYIVPFDMKNPYSSLKYYNWLQKYGIFTTGESKIMGGHTIKFGNCIIKICANMTDPYSKPGWNKR